MQLSVGGVFDGIGLLAYGLHRAGLRHAWLCEVDPWRRTILNQRFPGVPVVPDVRLVGADAVPRVDVIAGGFPCKGASTAGKRTGFGHPETVLWREMARAIRELRPRYVLVENVANILALHDGAVWGEVLGDLAALGFTVEWDCLPAAAFGAPHLRDRVFAVAVADADGGAARTGEQTGGERAGRTGAARGAEPAPDAHRPAVRQQPVAERGRSGPPGTRGNAASAGDADRGAAQSAGSEWRGEPRRAAAAAAEPGGERRGADERDVWAREPHLAGSPVAVDWGEYEPAIRRWEAVIGRSAGEPLLSGVDARGARRMVRSRLSALGDGVLVHAGELCGWWIVNHAREHADLERAA